MKMSIQLLLPESGRRSNAKVFLRVLPAASQFFADLRPEYVLKVEPRGYSISRWLRVPFAPPMVCGTSKGPVLPWLIFWKNNPLTSLQISLFVSIVDEILLQDGDLEGARLLIVDLSAKALNTDGKPKVIDSSTIPRLTRQEVIAMLTIVADGFSEAALELAQKAKVKSKNLNIGAEQEDPNQERLF